MDKTERGPARQLEPRDWLSSTMSWQLLGQRDWPYQYLTSVSTCHTSPATCHRTLDYTSLEQTQGPRPRQHMSRQRSKRNRLRVLPAEALQVSSRGDCRGTLQIHQSLLAVGVVEEQEGEEGEAREAGEAGERRTDWKRRREVAVAVAAVGRLLRRDTGRSPPP